jgi:anti-sigma regulatory factor (Ser/Thr protein kinase)
MFACQMIIPVSDPSQIGAARRQVNRIAEQASFDETERGKAAIIVTELATNLARYATDGQILVQVHVSADRRLLDILSIDRGPGIPDVARSLKDGFSTGGTPGTGLGAARRMSTEFEIYSTQPAGTIVFCRLEDTLQRHQVKSTFSWGVMNCPAPNEVVCGDSWSLKESEGRLSLMLADGLGHGPFAAAAAEEATGVFDRDPFAPLPSIFNAAHVRMQGTRGGAMAAAQIDSSSGEMKYVGVGNIAGHLRGLTGETKRGLFSHNGTLGVKLHKIQQFDYQCPIPGLLVMHSDGLQTRWSLDSYGGLLQLHPALISAVLYRDFTRGHDDVTIAVVRVSSPDRTSLTDLT